MKYKSGSVYLISNLGDTRSRCFFSGGNFDFFKFKMTKYLSPNAEVLAYTLLPTAFYWLLLVNKRGSTLTELAKPRYNGIQGLTDIHVQQNLSKDIGTLLSSYTKAVNAELGRRGALFKSTTICKKVSDSFEEREKILPVVRKILKLPVERGLVFEGDEYPFSWISQKLLI